MGSMLMMRRFGLLILLCTCKAIITGAPNRARSKPHGLTMKDGGTTRRNAILVATQFLAIKPAISAEPSKLWISGKSEKPKDSKDKTGTKKDTKFLRCLSNCVSDCQQLGATGKMTDRDTCYAQCQDDCCETYEQCTCTLNPNLV
uniref:SREBP regulating gene protein n=1 Tax=Octactis speculum TaxID=3111310 RepID=A0A7S2H145_9STRA